MHPQTTPPAANILLTSRERDWVFTRGKTLEQIEGEAIRSAFFRHKGNRKAMQSELRIGRTTLKAKLAKLGLRTPRRVRHLTEVDLLRAFLKHRKAIATELRAVCGRGRLMDPAGLPALIEAIRHLHRADATWVESVAVRETFNGAVVWDGEVQVFELRGHALASRAYAWSHESGPGGKRRFVAVLHEGPIDSPVKAVRAAIVASAKKGEGR
jgi:hypothetical protein